MLFGIVIGCRVSRVAAARARAPVQARARRHLAGACGCDVCCAAWAVRDRLAGCWARLITAPGDGALWYGGMVNSGTAVKRSGKGAMAVVVPDRTAKQGGFQ